MGLYGFKPQFVRHILAGTKRHTIRHLRRYPDKPGNTLHLYSGLRTKKAKLIMRVRCTRIQEFTMDENHTVWIDGVVLSESETQRLARADGFSNFHEMVKFWDAEHDLPFVGQIVHWRES